MPWVEKKPPVVPSLEKYPPTQAKRFTDIEITHLISHRAGWLGKKMEELGITSCKKAIEFGIINIDYPLRWGFIPDDTHRWNAFHGKACYTINLDFWQTASETMMTYILNNKLYGKHGYGDCEDSSMLIVGMLRVLQIPAYEILGYVYEDDRLLGGHGYLIAQFPEDKKWHLVESTLDIPPKYPDGYPVVDPNSNTYRYKSYTYLGIIKYNESEYYEWEGEMEHSEEQVRFKEYIKMSKKHKHKHSKVKKIREAWKPVRR